MLTPESYQAALLLYLAAGVLAVLVLWLWLRRIGLAWRILLCGMAAVLLLLPTYPGDQTETLAPVLLVAVFSLLTDGLAAALQPLRPAAFATALVVMLALLVGFRGRSKAAAEQASE